MPTDTERLDWLIKNRGMWVELSVFDNGSKIGGGFYDDEGSYITPRSDDPRKSIDLAIYKETADAHKI